MNCLCSSFCIASVYLYRPSYSFSQVTNPVRVALILCQHVFLTRPSHIGNFFPQLSDKFLLPHNALAPEHHMVYQPIQPVVSIYPRCKSIVFIVQSKHFPVLVPLQESPYLYISLLPFLVWECPLYVKTIKLILPALLFQSHDIRYIVSIITLSPTIGLRMPTAVRSVVAGRPVSGSCCRLPCPSKAYHSDSALSSPA